MSLSVSGPAALGTAPRAGLFPLAVLVHPVRARSASLDLEYAVASALMLIFLVTIPTAVVRREPEAAP